MINVKKINEIQTKNYYVWIAKQLGFADYPYIIDAYSKHKGGVKHIVHRFANEPTVKDVLEVLKQGYFSKRPYQLRQSCDGSIDSPVFALFNDFCVKKNLDPIKIYNSVYDDSKLTKEELEIYTKFAEWQGVKYPKKWDKEAYEGLLDSLTEINNHSLVGYLSENIT